MIGTDQDRKTDIIGNYKTHTEDTGSPEVGRASASASRPHRALQDARRIITPPRALKLVGQRHNLLDYLKRKDATDAELIRRLGIRK